MFEKNFEKIFYKKNCEKIVGKIYFLKNYFCKKFF